MSYSYGNDDGFGFGSSITTGAGGGFGYGPPDRDRNRPRPPSQHSGGGTGRLLEKIARMQTEAVDMRAQIQNMRVALSQRDDEIGRLRTRGGGGGGVQAMGGGWDFERQQRLFLSMEAEIDRLNDRLEEREREIEDRRSGGEYRSREGEGRMGPEREGRMFDMMEAELERLREENRDLEGRIDAANIGEGDRRSDGVQEAEIERLRSRVRACEEELDTKHDLIESMEQQIERLGGGAARGLAGIAPRDRNSVDSQFGMNPRHAPTPSRNNPLRLPLPRERPAPPRPALSRPAPPRRELTRQERGHNLVLGLFPAINPIPRDDRSCPICSDDYTLEEGQTNCAPRRMTCCNKSIGGNCLINWMRENVSCPFCRRDWTTEVERVLRGVDR